MTTQQSAENARINANNANNTAQWVRAEFIKLQGTVSDLGHTVSMLQAQVQDLNLRLQALEDRFA